MGCIAIYKQADNTRQRHFHKGARAITDHTHLDVGERHGATCDPGAFIFDFVYAQ